jgi:hypothetical protein
MSHKHANLLRALFHDPVSGNIHWREIESLLNHVGAKLEPLSGARFRATLNGAEAVTPDDGGRPDGRGLLPHAGPSRGASERDGGTCGRCTSFLAYADARLDHCPYGEEKPTCANCPIHCYKREPREFAREVMRYAGPRMLLRHPVLAVLHLVDGRGGKVAHPLDARRDGARRGISSASASARGRVRIVDPLAQQRAAVDQVDREPVALVLVGEVAPQRVVRVRRRRIALNASACRRHGRNARGRSSRPRRGSAARAELARRACGRSARTSTRAAGSREPLRRERAASREHGAASRSGAPNSSSGRVVPRPFGQRRALEHHRAGVAARHRQVRRVRARVHPAALAERPAVARRALRLPARASHHL